MPYSIPLMPTLLAKIRELKEEYQSDRAEFDKNRLFGSWLPETKNPERQNDIDFIQYIAFNISKNKSNYHNYDATYPKETYAAETSPFIKHVIAGALLLSLIEITDKYSKEESVKKSSALGKNILDIFDVEKLSEIPEDEIQKSLEALRRYVKKVPVAVDTPEAPEARERSEWHPSKTQGKLLEEIKNRLAAYTPAPVCN